jgi:cell division septation protein DedD
LSRDRKSGRQPARGAGRSGGGILVGIFIGLVFGALIAVGAAWYFTRANPFQSAPVAPRPSSEPGSAPLALPGKPGDRPVVKQDFEFYKILPQGEPQEAAPPALATSAAPKPADPKVAAAKPLEQPRPTEPKPAETKATERLYLQIGSFENPAEADNLKARLALAGIEASAQRARLPDGRVVHRVRVGPFSNPEHMNPMRARLAESGFAGTVTRNGQ